MKLIKFLPLAAIALFATSCQNEGGGLSDTSTRADSLMYYLGQMRAADYNREAKRDTVFDTPGAKKAYLAGFQAGMNGMRADDEAYNRGFMQGMQMAMNMHEFSENYDIKLNSQVFISSLSKGLSADSLPPTRELQADFRKVMENINAEKEEKDKVASRETLGQEAAKLDLPKINDDLYGKVVESTEGEQLKKDDPITLEISLSKPDGSRLRSQFPSKSKVGGANIPEVVSQALETMKDGERGKFATSATALYGSNCKRMGLEPTETVVFTVKADLVKEEAKDKEAK